jgi:RNA polymerase sigma factor (sigma-70 family)
MDSRLLTLTRADAKDSPHLATPLNIEIATAYALRSVEKIARRLHCNSDIEGYEEAVMIAVLRAAERYRPDNETKASFFTYAHTEVGFAIKEEKRRQMRRVQALSEVSIEHRYADGHKEVYARSTASGPDVYRSMDRDDTFTVGSSLSNGNGEERTVRIRLIVEDLLTRCADLAELDQRSREILYLRFVRGVKQKIVARHFNISPGRVHQIEDEAIEKLRAVALTSIAETDLSSL